MSFTTLSSQIVQERVIEFSVLRGRQQNETFQPVSFGKRRTTGEKFLKKRVKVSALLMEYANWPIRSRQNIHCGNVDRKRTSGASRWRAATLSSHCQLQCRLWLSHFAGSVFIHDTERKVLILKSESGVYPPGWERKVRKKRAQWETGVLLRGQLWTLETFISAVPQEMNAPPCAKVWACSSCPQQTQCTTERRMLHTSANLAKSSPPTVQYTGLSSFIREGWQRLFMLRHFN